MKVLWAVHMAPSNPALAVLFHFSHFPPMQFEAEYEIVLTLRGWAQYAYRPVIDTFKT